LISLIAERTTTKPVIASKATALMKIVVSISGSSQSI
jgi:hypothetical protein